MNGYQVFARKLRPQTFKEVIAQSPIVTTLKNAIEQRRTAHAYLFCGSKGTGKTTLARLFAKAVNCMHLTADIEPCNTCSSCREIAGGHAIDVLEIDGASHRGIEDVRMINETIGFAPVGKRYKIYLIDEVHMLTKEAFNALLKTLEEPPPHVKFLFCTTEAHKIPATILSRCQRFHLLRIPAEKIVEKLGQVVVDNGAHISNEALSMLAKMSEGSLRDALLLLEQLLSFENKNITAETVSAVFGLPSQEMFFALAAAGKKNDLTKAFQIVDDIFSSGKNISYFIDELISHFRTLLLIKNGIESVQKESRKQYEEASLLYSQDQLVQILEFLTEGQQTIKSAPSLRTSVEMLLLKILRTHRQISLESLVERLLLLEQRLAQGNIAEAPALVIEKKNDKAVPQENKEPLTEKTVPVQINSAIRQPVSAQLQSRFDTVMRFAAKELNGSLKKE